MRDNGLSAASYASMGDISPEVAGPVLEALATAGIAAYAEPSGNGGADQLYVDAAAVDRAGPVIRRGTEEAAWRSIVEQFNAPAADGHELPSAGSAVSSPEEAGAGAGAETGGSAPRSPEEAGGGAGGGAGAGVADGSGGEDAVVPREEEHYVPPEPVPGPRLDWISRLAWTGVLGGPVLLILAALFDVGGNSRITLAALIGFAGGFLTLVFRMKDRPDIDDTPDNGAVV